jgi:hypothetical protein
MEKRRPNGDVGPYSQPMGGIIYLGLKTVYPAAGKKEKRPRFNKTDKNRITRCRSLYERYHPALNVAEILEEILTYVVRDDPRAAIWFLRALENLGMQRNAEGMFLSQKAGSSLFSRSFSVGILRGKMMKGKHCVDCFDRLRSKGLNEIDGIPRCWKCLTKRHRLVTQARARTYLAAREVSSSKIKCLLSLKNSGCRAGVDGHLKRVEYMKVPHFLKEDLRNAVKEHGRRGDPFSASSPLLFGEAECSSLDKYSPEVVLV